MTALQSIEALIPKLESSHHYFCSDVHLKMNHSLIVVQNGRLIISIYI